MHSLPARLIARVVTRLEGPAVIPRPEGCKKLKGGEKEWRIRVGDYRIVYVIGDKAETIDVTRIAHRREVYD